MSVLEAVRQCPWGEDVAIDDIERSRKRRRLNSPQSATTIDSGYNSASDEEHAKESWANKNKNNNNNSSSSSSTVCQQDPASPHMIESASMVNNKLRRRIKSEPCSSTSVPPPASLRKFASRVQSYDRQRLDRRWSQPETSLAPLRNDRDADLEILAAQHQIAVARQALYGRNGVLPIEPAAKKDLGCARPSTRKATDVFGMFVEGCRVMDHERNLLSSLFSPPVATTSNFTTTTTTTATSISPLDPPAPAVAVKDNEDEQVIHFPGLIMPADTGNDDQDFECFEAAGDASASNDIECFFNLDEASSPSDAGFSI